MSRDASQSAVVLESLEVSQFRNLEPVNLKFCDRLNLFVGDNAQGKTNVLDAIYLLTALRGFRSTRVQEMIRWNHAEAVVRGRVRSSAGSRDVEVRLSPRGRQVKVDGKTLRDVSEFADVIKVVLFTPEDLTLIRGAPSLRRAFLDAAIAHLYPQISTVAREYQQVILQKNKLISQTNPSELMLEVWNERLAELGARLITARQRFVRRIEGLFVSSFREISGTELPATVSYSLSIPQLEGLKGAVLRLAFLDALRGVAREEIRRGHSTYGPHRDDLEVKLDGRLAATYGSQGQARMLSLSLKMVELRVLLEERNLVPMLLLDDVSSELDESRNRFLFSYLNQLGGQIFVTSTSETHVLVEVGSSVEIFRVSAGNVESDRQSKY